MFDYTRAGIKKIFEEIGYAFHVLEIASLSFMFIYAVASCFIGIGYLVSNVIIAVVSVTNLIMYLAARRQSKKPSRGVRQIKHIRKVVKILLDAVSLSAIIYNVIVSPENVASITYITTPLLIIVWVISTVSELLSFYVESRKALIMDAFQMDVDSAPRPVKAVTGLVSGIFGEESRATHDVDPRRRSLLEGRAREAAGKKEKKPRLFDRVSSLFKRKKDGSSEE